MSKKVHCSYCKDKINHENDLVVARTLSPLPKALHNRCYVELTKQGSYVSKPINNSSSLVYLFAIDSFLIVYLIINILTSSDKLHVSLVILLLLIIANFPNVYSYFVIERNV